MPHGREKEDVRRGVRGGSLRTGPAPELINDFTVRVSYTQWYRNPFLRSDRQYVFDRAIRDETGAVYQDGLLGDARPQVLYIELAEPDGAPFVLEVPLEFYDGMFLLYPGDWYPEYFDLAAYDAAGELVFRDTRWETDEGWIDETYIRP